jgi:hypothetical protein
MPAFQDNPIGDAFESMADDGKRFLCMTNVNEFRVDSVVSRRDLGPGAEIQRLIDLGAIVVLIGGGTGDLKDAPDEIVEPFKVEAAKTANPALDQKPMPLPEKPRNVSATARETVKNLKS